MGVNVDKSEDVLFGRLTTTLTLEIVGKYYANMSVASVSRSASSKAVVVVQLTAGSWLPVVLYLLMNSVSSNHDLPPSWGQC